MENEISAVEFDATFYLQQNPDVLRAIQQGLIANAAAHFLQFGQYEGRDPNVFFDTDYYLAENPDVLLAIDAGLIGSAFEHFVRFGFQEGVDRAPSEAFASFDEAAYLAANPDVAEAVEDGVFENGFEHFLRFGVNEERPGSGVDLDDLDPSEGETFTLTAENDTFEGTTGNDTFQGRGADLNGFDNLQGNAGDDTLNLFVNAGANVAVPATATVEGIETININRAAGPAGTVDASGFEGATQIWQIGNAGAISGLGAGQTAGFRNTAVDAGDTVTYEDGVTTAAIALDGVTGGTATLNVNGDDLTTINVSGSFDNGAGAETLNLLFGSNVAIEGELETINLDLTSDTTLTLSDPDFLSVTTVDASGSTGGITADLNTGSIQVGNLDLETINGGSGDDVLTLAVEAFGADEVSISGAAGDDTFNFEAFDASGLPNGLPANPGPTAFSLTGGEGNDRYDFDSLTNVTDPENLEESLITITDFDTEEDVLDLSGLGDQDTLTFDELGDIEEADSLEDAADVAAQFTAGGDYSIFNYEGDAYVFFNAAGPDAEVFVGDGLIRLAGVQVDQLDAQNFVA